MISRATRQLAVLALAGALAAPGCGGDSATNPTPPPDVAGQYSLAWTLQVLRKSDGFQKQFACFGTLTLTQDAASGSTAALGGFSTVLSNCAPESYDLRGSIGATGAVDYTTNGPKPPEGPCPGGKDVHYTGQMTVNGASGSLSARGVTTVSCPEFGEHEFTYLMTASK